MLVLNQQFCLIIIRLIVKRIEATRSMKGFLLLLTFLSKSMSEDFVPYLKEIGGTFCKYLAYKHQIPRKYLWQCPDPTCSWDDWNDSMNISKLPQNYKKRVVLSYAHNGFGNQLWQHTFAFMVAESLRARFMIAIIPDILCFDGATPPNTFAGMSAMERLLPDHFEYDLVPKDSFERQLCDTETFFISDRPRDFRNHNYTASMKANLLDIIRDPKPRCLKFLGYFQNYPLCSTDARRLWTPRMFSNFTAVPGPNDMSIYLRCLPRHYFFNDKHYYETILNGTSFDKIWLFQAPECPTRLSNNPSRDGVVAAVIRYLQTTYNAKRWPVPPNLDDTTSLLHDLAGLAQSRKLILPVSSWAYWAGFLSNATEIHVNAPPHHNLMTAMPNYVYHSEKARKFFGRYNNVSKDIEYALDNPLGASFAKKTDSHKITTSQLLDAAARPKITTDNKNKKSLADEDLFL